MSAEIPSEFPGLIWIFVGNKNLGGSGEGSSQKSCTCALSLTSLFQTCAQTVRCIHGEINTSVHRGERGGVYSLFSSVF